MVVATPTDPSQAPSIPAGSSLEKAPVYELEKKIVVQGFIFGEVMHWQELSNALQKLILSQIKTCLT